MMTFFVVKAFISNIVCLNRYIISIPFIYVRTTYDSSTRQNTRYIHSTQKQYAQKSRISIVYISEEVRNRINTSLSHNISNTFHIEQTKISQKHTIYLQTLSKIFLYFNNTTASRDIFFPTSASLKFINKSLVNGIITTKAYVILHIKINPPNQQTTSTQYNNNKYQQMKKKNYCQIY